MIQSDSAPAVAAPRSQRVEPIQWLRGVAAMLVVCNHSILLALKHLGTPDDPQHATEWKLAYAGAFGVDIFFIISGFVMAMSARRFHGAPGAADFLAQRYNRIAPLYYLLSAVLFADILRAHVAYSARDVTNTLTFIPWFDGRVYHWPIHYLGWTLAFEFLFYGVVAALIWLQPAQRLKMLAAILLILPLFGALVDWPWMPLRMLTSPMMIEFGLGVLLYQAWLAGWFDRMRARWHLLFGLSLLFYVWPVLSPSLPVIRLVTSAQFEWDGAASRVIWWGLPALAIVGWTLTLPLGDDRWPRRLARAIGDASYSIYLTHLFVVRLAEEWIERTDVPAITAAAVVVAVSPVVGYLSYLLLERPLLRIGQVWVARLRARFGRAARGTAGAT